MGKKPLATVINIRHSFYERWVKRLFPEVKLSPFELKLAAKIMKPLIDNLLLMEDDLE